MKKLYSVLLNENELLSLFSAETDLSIGTGVAVGGLLGGDYINKKSWNRLLNTEITAKDEEKIRKALMDEAQKTGVKVIETPSINNSFYFPDSASKKIKKELDKKGKKYFRDLNEADRKILNEIAKGETILLGQNFDKADTLSHELGHSKYLGKGRSNNILAKAASRSTNLSKFATSDKGLIGSAVLGLGIGYKNEKKKQKGKKLNTWDKVEASAIPAALVAPLLISEGAASIKGYKMMKKAGASKELLKQSRKRLGSAFGTYAGQASKPILLSEGGKFIGKSVAKIEKEDSETSDK